jgi:hypothetical protein
MSHSPRDIRNDDRVLDGLPVDGGAESLASLMDALRVPGLDHELSDQAQSVAAFTAALGAADTVDRPRRGPVRSRRSRYALSLALSGAALVATCGLAYAGALPGAAQDTARGVLAGLGVTVPGPNQHAGTHPDSRGNSAAAPGHAATGDTTDATGDTSSGKGKGAAISALARTTTATGRDKGAIISTAASGGKSHAGNPPGGASAHQPGTSDQGGTGTADGASGGQDSNGSSTAQTASDGHSSAGSGNAGSHPAAH